MRYESRKISIACVYTQIKYIWLFKAFTLFIFFSIFCACLLHSTVTNGKLGQSLNDYCVLPGWSGAPCFFPLYSYVSEDKADKISLIQIEQFSLGSQLKYTVHSNSHLAVVFSKRDDQTLTFHSFTNGSGNHMCRLFCLIAIGIDNYTSNNEQFILRRCKMRSI